VLSVTRSGELCTVESVRMSKTCSTLVRVASIQSDTQRDGEVFVSSAVLH
jgi:hypothetical protein